MLKKGALDGITVVDLSRLLPGPYCSMILADHGARVLAVEERTRQQENLFISSLYRNKEHLFLNLKSDQGLAIFFRLMAIADVLIEGFRPGVASSLGVDYSRVAQHNPGIVYCSISGYGQTGSYRDRAGHDVNYLAQAGVLDLIGSADGPPVIPGVQFADLLGGGLNGALGIVLALLERQTTGQGQYIDISMTDGSFSLLHLAAFLQESGGREIRRGQHLLAHRYACYTLYSTKDGRYLSVGALEKKFWKNLCEFMECPYYIPLQFDEERRQEVLDFFQEKFLQKNLEEWEAALKTVDACCEPVRTLTEAFQSPLFRERGMVAPDADFEESLFSSIGIPVKLSRTPGSLRTAPTSPGRDTQQVLQELGYPDQDIERFLETGIC